MEEEDTKADFNQVKEVITLSIKARINHEEVSPILMVVVTSIKEEVCGLGDEER